MLKTIRFILPLTLLLGSCVQENEQEKHGTNAISVIDDSGVAVTLNSPAQRIIALAPSIVENVYSAGAGEQLVASVNFANYPPEAESLPRVGGYNAFNLESIAALEPDIIFVWRSGTPPALIEKIKQLGIPIYFDEPSTMKDVAKSIRDIGKLTGHEEHANQVADKYLNDLAKLKDAQTGKAQINVFYQVWDDPLYTINGKQIISDVLRLCGGVNIYADEDIKAPIISLESLIERDPQAIITGSTHISSDTSLERWKKWPTMSAVKHENLFIVNADKISRHTARLLDGAASVCEKLDIARKNIQQ